MKPACLLLLFLVPTLVDAASSLIVSVDAELESPRIEKLVDEVLPALGRLPGVRVRDDRAGLAPADRASDLGLHIAMLAGSDTWARCVVYETAFGTICEDRFIELVGNPARSIVTMVDQVTRQTQAREFAVPISVAPVSNRNLPADAQWLPRFLHELLVQKLAYSPNYYVLQRRFLERVNLDAEAEPDLRAAQEMPVVHLQPAIAQDAEGAFQLTVSINNGKSQTSCSISFDKADLSSQLDPLATWLAAQTNTTAPTVDRRRQALNWLKQADRLAYRGHHAEALAAAEAAYTLDDSNALARLRLARKLLDAACLALGMNSPSIVAKGHPPGNPNEVMRALTRISRACWLLSSCSPDDEPMLYPGAFEETGPARWALANLAAHNGPHLDFAQLAHASCVQLIAHDQYCAKRLRELGHTKEADRFFDFAVRDVFLHPKLPDDWLPEYAASAVAAMQAWRQRTEAGASVFAGGAWMQSHANPSLTADFDAALVELSASPHPLVRVHAAAARVYLALNPKSRADRAVAAQNYAELAAVARNVFDEFAEAPSGSLEAAICGKVWTTLIWVSGSLDRAMTRGYTDRLSPRMLAVVKEMIRRGDFPETAAKHLLFQSASRYKNRQVSNRLHPDDAQVVTEFVDFVAAGNYRWLPADGESSASLATRVICLDPVTAATIPAVSAKDQLQPLLPQSTISYQVPRNDKFFCVIFNTESRYYDLIVITSDGSRRRLTEKVPSAANGGGTQVSRSIPLVAGDATICFISKDGLWLVPADASDATPVIVSNNRFPAPHIVNCLPTGDSILVGVAGTERSRRLDWILAGNASQDPWHPIAFPDSDSTTRYARPEISDWWRNPDGSIDAIVYNWALTRGERWHLAADGKAFELRGTLPEQQLFTCFNLGDQRLVRLHDSGVCWLVTPDGLVRDDGLTQQTERLILASGLVRDRHGLWALGTFPESGGKTRLALLAPDGTPTFYDVGSLDWHAKLGLLDGKPLLFGYPQNGAHLLNLESASKVDPQ